MPKGKKNGLVKAKDAPSNKTHRLGKKKVEVVNPSDKPRNKWKQKKPKITLE